MGEKSAQNLIESLQRARTTTLPRLLIALGIRHVGEGVAEFLASHFGDLDPIIAASRDELEAIEGIGPTIAESVAAFFDDPRNAEETRRLIEFGVRWPAIEPAPPGGDALEGVTFVLTGTFEGMTRDEAKRRIQAQGGKVTASVSKKNQLRGHRRRPGQQSPKSPRAGNRITRRSWTRIPPGWLSAN